MVEPNVQTPEHTLSALDISAAAEVRECFLKWLAEQQTVVVDLAEVAACDAAGLQLLVAAHKSASSAGKSFYIKALSPAVTDAACDLGFELSPFLGVAECNRSI